MIYRIFRIQKISVEFILIINQSNCENPGSDNLQSLSSGRHPLPGGVGVGFHQKTILL